MVSRPYIPAIFIVGTIEVLALKLIFDAFSPSTLSADVVRIFLEKVLDVDGVLLGFSGLILAVIIQRSKLNYLWGILSLMAVSGTYLSSIFFAFAELLDVDAIATSGSVPVFSSPLLYPVILMVIATNVLFFALKVTYNFDAWSDRHIRKIPPMAERQKRRMRHD